MYITEALIYSKIKRKWTTILSKQLKGIDSEIQERFGVNKGNVIVREVQQEFNNLLYQIPILDKSASPIWQRQLILTTVFISFYKVLKQFDVRPDEAWELCMIMYGKQLQTIPKFVRSFMSKSILSQRTINRFKRDESVLNKRMCSEGDLLEMVENDGDYFNYGMNIKECAKVKLAAKLDVLEFMPYICLVDKVIAESMGVGMVRTKTIADGYDHCDFRFNDSGYIYFRSPVYESKWDDYSAMWKK